MKKLSILGIIMLICIATTITNGCKKKDTPPAVTVTSLTFSVPAWSSNSLKWYTDLSVPALTSANINSASVQVYLSTASGTWTALPFTEVRSIDYFMNYTTSIGLVEVNWIFNSAGIGSDPNSIYSATCQFKVVVIPPAARKSNPNLN